MAMGRVRVGCSICGLVTKTRDTDSNLNMTRVKTEPRTQNPIRHPWTQRFSFQHTCTLPAGGQRERGLERPKNLAPQNQECPYGDLLLHASTPFRCSMYRYYFPVAGTYCCPDVVSYRCDLLIIVAAIDDYVCGRDCSFLGPRW